MNPVIVIGLGGIGSHLVEPLARFLSTLSKPPELVLVDGDAFTTGNRGRQRTGPGDIGLNKAMVHAQRLLSLLPGLRVRAVEQYVSERNALEIISEGALSIVCPDNHATRLTVSRRCQRIRNAAAIFVGNDLRDGAIQIYVRRNGRDLKPRPEQYHPEIASPAERNPADLSCEELAARQGGGQVIFANLMAATLALNAAYALLQGQVPGYGEVFFDVLSNVARTAQRR
jgi:molybdopterin/thiamine biosynthesis adenylyltransferase